MARGNLTHVKAGSFRPIKDNVFVSDLDSGPTVTAGGIIRPDDNMSETGIRSRWGRVFAIGPDVEDIEVGEWVLIEHARWTNAIDLELPSGKTRIWKIEWPKSVLVATKEDPREQQLSNLPTMQHPGSDKHRIRSVTPSIIRKRDY